MNFDEQSHSLAESIRYETARIAELENRRMDYEREMLAAKAKLTKAQAAQPIVLTSDLSVESEGTWPSSRPYFYLAKKHLSDIYYDTFNANGKLSREAASVFGMTTAEQRAVNQSIDAVLSETRSQELRHAYLTNAPPIAKAQPGDEKISVFVPAITNTEAIRQEFANNIHSILGPERSPLFLERAQEGLRQFEEFIRKDRTVTFIPKDEMSGGIIILDSDGSSTINYYDFNRSQDFMVTQYGHLLREFVNTAALP
jgi:hypothetical protein